MRPIDKPLGPFAMRFWHRFGFFDHRKARSRCSDSAFAPPGRFSAWFGTRGRCAKLTQKTRHHPAHLPRGGRTLVAFPWTQDCHAERLGEQQLIAGTRYNPTPAFDLLGSAQMRLGPEQILLEEAIAMLLGETLAIPGAYLFQAHILTASPDEPTLARITLGVTGSCPQHADHTDFGLGCLLKMQVLPTRDDHALAVLIDPFPL